MIEETALWIWFVFYSGLPTQRAKALLEAWHAQDISLTEALRQPQSRAGTLGLTPGEAGLLTSGRTALTPSAPSTPALTWHDDLYPAGLRALPLKIRPALLFYQGASSLLSRTLAYLAPGPLAPDAAERAREAISLLLGEHILLAAFEDTPQAALAMEEMISAEGELLLFAQSGLGRRAQTGLELELTAQDRLVVLSPLPPDTPRQAGLNVILQQVAWYASSRVIITAESEPAALPLEWLGAKPIIELAEPKPRPISRPWIVTSDPMDVLAWIGELSTGPERERGEDVSADPQISRRHSMPLAQSKTERDDGVPLLPPSPEEILKTLSRGGVVPEALRKRIVRGQ